MQTVSGAWMATWKSTQRTAAGTKWTKAGRLSHRWICSQRHRSLWPSFLWHSSQGWSAHMRLKCLTSRSSSNYKSRTWTSACVKTSQIFYFCIISFIMHLLLLKSFYPILLLAYKSRYYFIINHSVIPTTAVTLFCSCKTVFSPQRVIVSINPDPVICCLL